MPIGVWEREFLIVLNLIKYALIAGLVLWAVVAFLNLAKKTWEESHGKRKR